MYLTTKDIACYIFCPRLQQKQRKDILFPPLSMTEVYLRRAFVAAEAAAALKDNIVTSRKLLSAWEKLWWPAVANTQLDLKAADAASLKASYKFTDYCKYDISDWMFPTVGANVNLDMKIGSTVIKAHADVVKVDMHQDTPTTVLINFGTQDYNHLSAAADPVIKATAYAFYSGRNETIVHSAVNISDRRDKIKIVTSVFRPKVMDEIRKMLYYVSRGITAGTYFPNPSACKDCRVCQNFI